MGTGDVDLFPSTARRLGVGKVCDEDYPFACQYCRERWLKKKRRGNKKKMLHKEPHRQISGYRVFRFVFAGIAFHRVQTEICQHKGCFCQAANAFSSSEEAIQTLYISYKAFTATHL